MSEPFRNPTVRCRIRIAVVASVIAAIAVVPAPSASQRTAVAAAPPAPVLTAPANGASVTIPFTISWSEVAGAGGYEWEISVSADFATVLERSAELLVGASTTRDTVSGLPNGTYFWRARAVSPSVERGPWSEPRNFTVTGASSGVPGVAVLDPPHNTTRFHAWETITFTWTPVPGAVSYILQESTDPTFPVGTRLRQVNIPGPTERISINPGSQGNYRARVIAVDTSGLMGQPSNVVEFSVLDSNPFPPPPTLVGPANGTSHQLPLTLSWTHVPNHDERGYHVQIATNSSFTSIETSTRVTEDRYVVPALSTGTKFWRVRSQHGYIGADEAFTAWSATGTFTVLATPLRMAAVSFPATKFSGGEARGSLDLTGPAPAGGATVTLTTDRPDLLPELPSSRVIPAGTSSVQVLVAPTGFPNSTRGMRVGFVTEPAVATVTATFNGSSVSTPITIVPPRLNDTPLQLFPVKATGGTEMFGILDLEVGCFAGFCDGLAPPGGFPVSVSSSSPAAVVPATVTIPAGAGGTQFSIRTNPVTTVTVVTISARAGGWSANWYITLTPPSPVDSLTLDPAETVDGGRGIVRIPLSAMRGHDQELRLTSSDPAVAAVPATVRVPASTEAGVFFIDTAPVTTRTVVTISVAGAGGVTRSSDLVVHPSLPRLSGFSVNPTSVAGGTNATGTVTLDAPAPEGGLAVSLGSSLPSAASVPPTVTVPGGATSASFTVTTFPVDDTTAQLNATLGSTTLFAALGVTRSSSIVPTGLTLSPTAVVGGSSSTATVRLSAAAPSGGAVVTLSDDSPAATVPATVTVPAGATSRSFTVTTTTVSTSTSVRISASLGGGTTSASLTVNALAAPTLQAPANGATGVAQPVAFNWTDVANAVDYEIQIDDTSTIAAPLVAEQVVRSSQASIGNLPAQQLWWRVRARNAAGEFGPFSATRRFTPVASSGSPSLSSVAVSPTTVVGGAGATGTITLTAAAPSGGAAVTLTSSNPAAAVPPSATIAAGARTATFPVTTSSVAATTNVTLTATYGGISRTTTLTVSPPSSGTLPAPSLISPSSDARFSAGGTIVFDWSDVAGAAQYVLQIDDQETFGSPIVNTTTSASTASVGALPSTRMWWRVRAIDPAGVAGAWSSVRRFEVR